MKKDKFITDFEDIPTPRQKMPHLSLEERKLNFKEVDLGFTEEIALKETSRCLSCRRCIGCGLCLAECDQQAIIYDQKEEYTTVQADAVVLAVGTENFDARRKPELGYAFYPNVITAIEMERILSADGPYGGILMRPSDGEIPQRIAFIQCVGSRDEDLGVNYCSNICCLTALKQALLALDRIDGLEVTIFYKDIRPFAKDSEHYYLTAKNEYGVKFIPAKVNQVIENFGTSNLTIKYARNGTEETADFDLVVLSTGITSTAGIKRLSRQVNARLNKYGFFPASDKVPVATSGDDVWFAGSMTHPTDLAASLAQANAVAAKVLQSFVKKDLPLARDPGPGIKMKERTPSDRIGVFFCRYGISTQLNIDQDDVIKFLINSVDDLFVSDLEYACNTTGKQAIVAAVEGENLGRIIIAPCYAKKSYIEMYHQLIQTAGLPKDRLTILTAENENGGLNTEDVKQKLLGLIQSDHKTEAVPEPEVTIVPEACVIGGSVTALQSALDIAEQGFPVHLLVSESELAQTEQQIFWHYENLPAILNDLKQKVLAHPKIQIHKESQVINVEGEYGNYKISFIENGTEKSISGGAIVIAPGAQAYKPIEFGYHENKNVISQCELKSRLSAADVAYQKIVMIQCVGSRQPDRPSCSHTCCEQAIKNALKLKELKPEVDIYVLHRDIRVYDFEEDSYAEALEKRIKFIRMDKMPEIKPQNEKFDIKVVDRLSNNTIQLEADLIVLSTGIVPLTEYHEIANILGLSLNPEGFFLDNNNHRKPWYSDKSGIFIAGLAQAPQRLENILVQGSAVAGKIGVIFRNKKISIE